MKKCHIIYTTGIFLVIGFWVVSKLFYSQFKGPTTVQRGAGGAEKNSGERNSTVRSLPESAELSRPYWSTTGDIKGKLSGGKKQGTSRKQ